MQVEGVNTLFDNVYVFQIELQLEMLVFKKKGKPGYQEKVRGTKRNACENKSRAATSVGRRLHSLATKRKTSWSKGENQQQTKRTFHLPPCLL